MLQGLKMYNYDKNDLLLCKIHVINKTTLGVKGLLVCVLICVLICGNKDHTVLHSGKHSQILTCTIHKDSYLHCYYSNSLPNVT